jgi:two-component system, LuxR family, response regulator FixJ
MSSADPLVYVIDDDEAVLDSLRMLLKSLGLESSVHTSAFEFLDSFDPDRHACLVCDIRMPSMSGLELQQRLLEDGFEVPIIFITGHGDVPMAVNAMKSGAFDFIPKPFRDQDLIDRVHKALQQDRQKRAARREELTIRECLKTLTPREMEVMRRVVSGQANKVIAMDLGVSPRTVELHRARVMRKLHLRSVAALVKAVSKVSLPPPAGTAE